MNNNSFFPDSRQSMGLAVIYLVFGFVVAFFSTSILRTAVRVLGVVVVCYGAWQIFMYLGRNIRQGSYLVMGIPAVLIGLICMISPNTLVGLIPSLVGIVLVVNGAAQLFRALQLKNAGFSNWAGGMIAAVVMLVLGILLWMRPISALNIVFKAAGFFLMAEGVVMLLDQRNYNKYF